MINEALAKKYFGQRDPIGMHAGFGGGKVAMDMLIVGIVKNDKQDHVRSELAPFIFVPYSSAIYSMACLSTSAPNRIPCSWPVKFAMGFARSIPTCRCMT